MAGVGQQCPQALQQRDGVGDVAGPGTRQHTENTGLKRVGQQGWCGCRKLAHVHGTSQRLTQRAAQPLQVPIGEALDARVLIDWVLHGLDDETAGDARRAAD